MERSWEPGWGIHASSATRVHPFWAGVCGLTLRRARGRRLVLLRIASGYRGANGFGSLTLNLNPAVLNTTAATGWRRAIQRVRAVCGGAGSTGRHSAALSFATAHYVAARYVAFTALGKGAVLLRSWGAVYSGIGDVRTVGVRTLFERTLNYTVSQF